MIGLLKFTERRGTLQSHSSTEVWVNPEAIDCLRVISTGTVMILRSGQSLYLSETTDEIVAALQLIGRPVDS
jgi:hypothetical protein